MKIAVVGVGQMGSAIIKGLLNHHEDDIIGMMSSATEILASYYTDICQNYYPAAGEEATEDPLAAALGSKLKYRPAREVPGPQIIYKQGGVSPTTDYVTKVLQGYEVPSDASDVSGTDGTDIPDTLPTSASTDGTTVSGHAGQRDTVSGSIAQSATASGGAGQGAVISGGFAQGAAASGGGDPCRRRGSHGMPPGSPPSAGGSCQTPRSSPGCPSPSSCLRSTGSCRRPGTLPGFPR